VLDAINTAWPAIDWRTIGVEEARALLGGPSMFAPGDEVASVTDRSISGPGGSLRLRLYQPPGTAGPLPMTVYLHGGGFCTGAPEGHDNVCRSLARRASTLVVSVDYRLAPESPFPAAVHDALAALRWVREHAAEIGGDAARVAVAGDSAGATLATVIARLARDEGPALRHQLLLYPVTDSGCDFASYTELAHGHLLTTEMMRWYWRHYLSRPQDRLDPQACPLRQSDLAAVAPATFVIAGFDPASDEGRAYAAALRDAGVAVSVHEWPDQIHGFASMLGAIDAADAALDQGADALRRAFA
ncbi:MAG TPA: alpha/beta hydrolase, partial [Burkholderiaceae bacterium]|nr:alpha/beta hydrolase [Burkholderiaceae bacterium]